MAQAQKKPPRREPRGLDGGSLWLGEISQGLGVHRAALELGGYQRKFFISHNPEAWALADVVIDTAGLRAVG